MSVSKLEIKEGVPLSGHTTIGVGGRARFFFSCGSVEHLRTGLLFAKEKGLRAHILGGGSNTIIADAGFDGVVLKIDLQGVRMHEEGAWLFLSAAAGEKWDELVKTCVERDAAGIECLSGIPGTVGATPIQNVGAYGQEVSETIVSLRLMDRDSLEMLEMDGRDCEFRYRQSRFKSREKDRYIITEVTYRLRRHASPEVEYPELARHLALASDLGKLEGGRASLKAVREGVIALRRKKSMVIDPSDPNSRSVGSFFLNPVLTDEELRPFQERCRKSGEKGPVSTFRMESGTKIPAAWLVEHAGFSKGYVKGGAGISKNHALAIVNCGGTAKEILALAEEIEKGVYNRFGIRLEREPVIVG